MRIARYPRPDIPKRIPAAGHVILEASAGTGKTFALQNLVVDLLLTEPYPSIEEILVVTFTEAATWELRGRIRKQIEEMISAIPPGSGMESAWEMHDSARARLEAALFAFDRAPIHTLHAFCYQLLRETAFETGTRFELELVEKTRIFHRALRMELREGISVDPGTRTLLKQWLESKSMEGLEKLLREAHFQRALATRTAASGEDADLEARVVDRFLPSIVKRLDGLKRDEGLMDYDDMIERVARALEGPGGPALADALRGRFCCALIDEFQDTDDLQWRIFRTLFSAPGVPNRLFVIGDPKQAIYGFRGADVHTYQRACAELKAAGAFEACLDVNFRSTGRMIDACNRILRENGKSALLEGDICYSREVTGGLPDLRALDARRKDVPPVTVLRYVPAGEKGGAAEVRSAIGRKIAEQVRAMLGNGGTLFREDGSGIGSVPPSRIYILTRSTSEGYEIGGYLRDAGVPHAYYKQDGLFETAEAFDTLDLLEAIARSGDRALRLRAWGTPFFAVPWRDLMLCTELPDGHPLMERLLSWSQLAEEGDFALLFDRVLHESGLVERELFLSDSERELTNYIHVLEILIEEATARKLALSDLVLLLRSYIQGGTHPLGLDGDVQRLERERAVVQIMTVHKCKGLEADVVFLFGGTGGKGPESPLAVYHSGGERRVAIGRKEKDAARGAIDEELAREDQRLLYVAITRASLKLFLPYVPAGTTKQEMKGYYRPLNDRLAALLPEAGEQGGLFEVLDAADRGSSRESDARVLDRMASWTPDPDLLASDPASDEFDALRKAHAAASTWSYSSLSRRREAEMRGGELEEAEGDLDDPGARAAPGELPGGLLVGRFLHAALERLPFGEQDEWTSYEAWKANPDVTSAFQEATRRHGAEPSWLDPARRLVFDALRVPVALARGDRVEGLYRCASVRELEFLYPIPETHHRLLSGGVGEGWWIERGYLHGYIDLVFTRGGLTYFADWKTDLLPAYSREAMAAHVGEFYSLQALIYTLAVVRLLGIRDERDYENRFGGLLYVFLRGMKPEGDGSEGVHYERPSWTEVQSQERSLLGDAIIPGGLAA